MEFEIAKKLEKLPANTKGNSLRSIKGDRDAATMIIVADTYGDIKSAVENFRMAKNVDISFRMRGKSIDITVLGTDMIIPGTTEESTVRKRPPVDGAINSLMEFAKLIAFNSEDVMDVIDFWAGNMPLSGCTFKEIDMDQNRLKLVMSSENLDQDAIMQKLDKYNMGIVIG